MRPVQRAAGVWCAELCALLHASHIRERSERAQGIVRVDFSGVREKAEGRSVEADEVGPVAAGEAAQWYGAARGMDAPGLKPVFIRAFYSWG